MSASQSKEDHCSITNLSSQLLLNFIQHFNLISESQELQHAKGIRDHLTYLLS